MQSTAVDRGVLYVATGPRTYIDEALASAASVKAIHPDLSITLITDAAGSSSNNIDQLILVQDAIHPLKQKVKCLPSSPYQRTLFLDTDTTIRKPIISLFERLDEVDFVIASAPDVAWQEQPPKFLGYEHESRFNTGVFLYRKSSPVKAFLRTWFEALRDQDESVMRPGSFGDQFYFNAIFGEAARECGMTWAKMPNVIYNARGFLENFLERDGLLSEVAIYHGRPGLTLACESTEA